MHRAATLAVRTARAARQLEGVVDHQLLGIHHVHPGKHQLAWDLGFLALGLLQAAAGAWLVRTSPLRQR